MCSDPAKMADAPAAFLVKVNGTVSPEAEATEDVATTELHEDQTIDLPQLRVTMLHGAFKDRDQQSEQENEVGVQPARDLSRKEVIGQIGGKPDAVDTHAYPEAIVVATFF